jgi:hypothetical protein
MTFGENFSPKSSEFFETAIANRERVAESESAMLQEQVSAQTRGVLEANFEALVAHSIMDTLRLFSWATAHALQNLIESWRS